MIRDPLEYTEDELQSLDIDTLEELMHTSGMLESLYDTKQTVNKRLMNALYGALGNAAFPLFNEDMASAITGNGRYFIRMLSNYIEETLQKLKPMNSEYILYNDTDSGYFTIAPFVNDFVKDNPNSTMTERVNFANQFEIDIIQPVIRRCVDDFSERLNAYNKESIWAEREIIADSAVFVSKKKYFARVRDSEGTRFPEDSPYIKVMGLELIKSSTPKWSQKMLKKAIPVFLDKTESQAKDWLRDVKKEFLTSELSDLASVANVNNLDYKLGDKGIPFGSRAAIIHNNYIKDKKLLDNYDTIKSGDKSKRLFLIKQNPFNSNIVAFTNDKFIDEIREYIDYDEIFAKNFLNPLEIMYKSLNWDLTKETEVLDEW